MHKSSPTPRTLLRALTTLRAGVRARAFSLVEVSLALAIVGIAFVALLGLLPAGMQITRKAADTAAAMRISTYLTSLLEATEYTKLTSGSTAIISDIYYFDSEGAYIDTEATPKSAKENERIYAARVIPDDQNIPIGSGAEDYKKDVARKLTLVIGKSESTSIGFMRSLGSPLSSDDLKNLRKKEQNYKVFPVLIAKTDGL